MVKFKDEDRFILEYFRTNGRWYVNNDCIGIPDEVVELMLEDGNILPQNFRKVEDHV